MQFINIDTQFDQQFDTQFDPVDYRWSLTLCPSSIVTEAQQANQPSTSLAGYHPLLLLLLSILYIAKLTTPLLALLLLKCTSFVTPTAHQPANHCVCCSADWYCCLLCCSAAHCVCCSADWYCCLLCYLLCQLPGVSRWLLARMAREYIEERDAQVDGGDARHCPSMPDGLMVGDEGL